MADWYRQSEWSEEIEEAFFARLKRARNKAQYLNIQAYTLLVSHPQIAARLCREALDLGTPDQCARAGLYLGTALAACGDIDGAIAALEQAIDAERAHTMSRTGAYIDQALLVAVSKRSEMYALVRNRLKERHPHPLDEGIPEILIAMALIGDELDEDVCELAAAALELLAANSSSPSQLPEYLNLNVIKVRLEQIAQRQRWSPHR